MRKHIMIPVFTLVVVLSLFIGACGAGQVVSVPTEVHVKLTDFKIEMDKTSIPTGPVKFIFDNAGGLEHEVVLEQAGDNDIPFERDGKASEAEAIKPGQSATLEWSLDKAGDYQLACHSKQEVQKDGKPDIVDHYALKMVQTFTVAVR